MRLAGATRSGRRGAAARGRSGRRRTDRSAPALARPGSQADFNRDGHQDFAASGDNGIVVRLGVGNGRFRGPQRYSTGRDPIAIAVGHLNDDDRPDLVVANQHDPSVGSLHHTVAVLLGKRHGRFRPAVRYRVGRDPESIAIGDLTGDGIPDIAVANNDFEASPDQTSKPKVRRDYVSILRGRGDGRFHRQTRFYTGAGPIGVIIAELNHDRPADLAVAIEGRDKVTTRLSR